MGSLGIPQHCIPSVLLLEGLPSIQQSMFLFRLNQMLPFPRNAEGPLLLPALPGVQAQCLPHRELLNAPRMNTANLIGYPFVLKTGHEVKMEETQRPSQICCISLGQRTHVEVCRELTSRPRLWESRLPSPAPRSLQLCFLLGLPHRATLPPTQGMLTSEASRFPCL